VSSARADRSGPGATDGPTDPDADPFVSAGVVDRSERGKLRLTGPQALWFCDQLLTNQVVALAEGAGAEALLLTPHGRITALLRLLNVEGEVLADTEPGRAPRVATFFQGRVFATRVDIADVTADLGIVAVLGPRADETVAAAGFPVPGPEEHADLRRGSAVAARVLRPIGGIDLWVPAGEVEGAIAALAAAGGSAASAGHYERLRIREGLARDRVDFDEGYLPQEAALERAVHFAKGCYLGQEAVAMTQRGRVKRRLRLLRFEEEACLGVVRHGGEEVGRVTSAADGCGIATVRTGVALGERVEVGDPRSAATVEELPGSVSGPRLPSARELRERLAGGAGPREGS
jgi:folate-binding protein YgfZ